MCLNREELEIINKKIMKIITKNFKAFCVCSAKLVKKFPVIFFRKKCVFTCSKCWASWMGTWRKVDLIQSFTISLTEGLFSFDQLSIISNIGYLRVIGLL